MNSIVKIPSTATGDCCTLIQVIPIPIPSAPRVGMSKPVARPRRTGRTYGPWSNLPGKNEKRGYDIDIYLFTTHLNCTKCTYPYRPIHICLWSCLQFCKYPGMHSNYRQFSIYEIIFLLGMIQFHIPSIPGCLYIFTCTSSYHFISKFTEDCFLVWI